MVREHVTIISAHAVELAKSNGKPGVLQLTRLSPLDERMVPTRFKLDDVDGMIRAAVSDSNALHNIYVEARTLRSDLRGSTRGALRDTEFVFGLVVDVDHDKGMGGAVTARPSLVVETSPGNYHYWYLFDRPVAASPAKALGDAIRAAAGADHDTGVVTQPYRVAGTINYPSKAKRAPDARTRHRPASSSIRAACGIPRSCSPPLRGRARCRGRLPRPWAREAPSPMKRASPTSSCATFATAA
jgi:hypothetical protein